jgi:hypothetical protein
LPDNELTVSLSLPLKTAEALHAILEDLLESGRNEAVLEEAYRVLAWRILAVKNGAGLTGRLSELARGAESLEEYETARDEVLGPILDGLESAENRDP